jgi:AcrR family transcriptional regulator
MTEFNEKQIDILQAAEKLFAENGFDGTSVRDIAKQANINIAMISYYFGSKEKLLDALVVYRTSDLKVQLDNILDETFSPMEKIDRFIDLYIHRINRNKCVYQIVHTELANKKRILDIKTFTKVKKKNLSYLQQIIEEGQQQGIFKKGINIPMIPPTIIGTFLHFHNNKIFFIDLLGLESEEAYENYLKNEVVNHIKQTIKALLIHGN